jgi:hypothetical protein
MSAEVRKIQTTDSRTSISFYLKQESTSGVLTAVDLTGLTSGAVKFEMFNAATDVETLALTVTGVTFSADATGLVNYEFPTPMVFPAGYYNAFFVLTVATKTDHFPVYPGGLRIEINSHVLSAKDAYEAAI